MTISAASTSLASSSGSSEATTLKQKLATLQKSLTTEANGKDDAKTKEAKEQAIQLEIEQVQAQIAKAQEKSGAQAPATQAPEKKQEGLPTYA